MKFDFTIFFLKNRHVCDLVQNCKKVVKNLRFSYSYSAAVAVVVYYLLPYKKKDKILLALLQKFLPTTSFRDLLKKYLLGGQSKTLNFA